MFSVLGSHNVKIKISVIKMKLNFVLHIACSNFTGNYHRMVRVGRDFKDPLVPTPHPHCRQGHLLKDQVLKASNNSRDGHPEFN